ncbi:MAG: penicillin-binding protein [Bacteroidota bacterium]|nr:penicillin-binding protein [Bacteroidota bacterium]
MHLAIYIVLMSLLFWILLSWLKSSTHHGEYIKVPDFNNVKIGELDKFIGDKEVRYLIVDSIYDVKAPKGSVVKQEPEAGAEVKKNRIVFLYVTSVLPPTIQMPKLVDRSLRQAASMITSYGLRLGKTKFVADQCANCILEQMVKGKKIKAGEPIEKGTVIDLVVGKGLSDEEVGVPCLYGLTRKQAMEKLSESSLTIGSIVFDSPRDSSLARVYRQTPACGKETSINLGSVVDIFLSADKNKVANPDTTTTDDENVD